MTDNTPIRGLTAEVAQLRHELAELRRDMACLTRDSLRQEKDHRALRGAVHEITVRFEQKTSRLTNAFIDAIAAAEGARKGVEHQDRRLDECAAWADGWLRELDMWVQYLAARALPKAQAFHYSELRRIFPRGCGFVPNYRLKKTPRNG